MFDPLKEIDIYGVFLPPLLVWATISVLVVKGIHIILAHTGFYQSDIQQQVFDASLFIIMTGAFAFLIH